MVEKKSCRFCLLVFLFCALRINAGDIATFTDLGFSENGRTYIFAQYGVEEASLIPWAELFIVDVASNNFVNGGKISYKHNKEIEAGQDGSGALYRLVAQNTALAGKYGVNFLRQGIPLFVSLENGHNPYGDDIEFRDFDTNISYRARLRPTVHGSGANVSSSFIIDLERQDGAYISNHTVGSPDVRRPRITSYTIKKVLVPSDRKSMVFIIEMTRQSSNNDGPDIRYMVETIRF